MNFAVFQKRPADNSFYVKTCNKNPKKTKWWYHGMYCNYSVMNLVVYAEKTEPFQ
jgi:ubiquitin-conjugating enzyme E2 W